MKNKEDPCQPGMDLYRARNKMLDKGEIWSVAARNSLVALSRVAEYFLLCSKISKTGNVEDRRLWLS